MAEEFARHSTALVFATRDSVAQHATNARPTITTTLNGPTRHVPCFAWHRKRATVTEHVAAMVRARVPRVSPVVAAINAIRIMNTLATRRAVCAAPTIQRA